MKAIQQVQVWKNGEEKLANAFNAILINDDLSTSATFYYQLLAKATDAEGNESSENLTDGNVACSGQDYIDWDNSNESAYQYIAAKLNLTIVD